MFSVTYLNHHLQKLLSVNLLDPDYYRDQDQTNWEYCNIIEIKMRLGKWLKTHKKYINNNNNNNKKKKKKKKKNLITISYQQSTDNNTKLLSKFTLRKFRCLMVIMSFLVQSLSNFQMTVESNYAIAIATLSDWLKRFAPVFQPTRIKTKTNRAMYAWFVPRFERVTGDC